MEKLISNSVEETLQIAEKYAETVEQGDVICLKGDLGAGKTHFVKGFVKRFGIDQADVSSPTFTLINEYQGDLTIYHFDCYRLENIEEALEIGAEEYLYDNGVCIVEWPERIGELLPPGCKVVTLIHTGPEKREIIFEQ
jgi:tRNA threonylcarbamoyladenosine biosynthesis protein TsaE